MSKIDCYLVVATQGALSIPEEYKDSSVVLSMPSACIVASKSGTTNEISRAFGFGRGGRGIVVKLDSYSSVESREVVEKWNKIEGK